MANTLIPIQTTTLTATAASVTFSNIPQNYTDLKIVLSARTTDVAEISSLAFSFGSTSYTYSTRILGGDGTNVYSSNSSDAGTAVGVYWLSGGSSTAATFANGEIYLPNYTSSTNKVFQYEILPEFNSATNRPMIGIVTVTKTDAVNQIILSANFAIGTTFTLYGISNGVKATGGTIVVTGGYAYHTFTSSGTFIPNQQIKYVDYLVVAGGGGGSRINGGGGAGGLRCTVDATGGGGSLESKLTLNAGTTYPVIIGSGGAGSSTSGTGQPGVNGTNSSFGSIVTLGGGGGGSYVGVSSTDGSGLSGGSGGGGGFREGNGNSLGGAGTYGQGYAGGGGIELYVSGGGGGAGGVGSAGLVASQPGGNGGVGVSIPTFGVPTGTGDKYYYYAGGGGAGDENFTLPAGIGGLGGGGNGASRTGGSTRYAGSAGTANTGGGGGGGENGGTGGYTGGSGIVIIRYPLNDEIRVEPVVTAPDVVTPLPVSGATVWLDASNKSSLVSVGNSLVQWSDLSGNGNHFSQSVTTYQPTTNTRTMNGKNVVDFDGTDDKLMATGSPAVWNPLHNATGATLFIVASLDVNQDQPILTTSNDTTQVGIWFYTRTTNTSFGAAILRGVSNNFVALEYTDTNLTYTANTPLVITTSWDASNATAADRIKYYKNSGSAQGVFQESTQSYTTANASHPAYLGAWPLSNAFNGVIAEVIMYSSVLSDSNRNAVSNYLKTKWGI